MKTIRKILNKMNTVKKIFLCLIIIVIIFSIVMLIINIPNFTSSKNDNNGNQAIEKIDQMENYDYYLDETATDYYKELYNELKDVLNNETINDDEYAKIVSRLFVTDLFTLDNKLTSSDIGGLQFVFTGFKDDFVNIAKTTLYASVESNIYGDRNQELPIVSNVQISSIEKSSFTYQNNVYDSYDVKVNITYEKDLGYPSEYKLVLINNDKYLQVVSGE